MNYRITKVISIIFIVSIFFSGALPHNSINKTSVLESSETSTVPTLSETKNDNYSPKLGKSFIGFREALSFKESQGDYEKINSLGYLGKYQFGKSTLSRLKIYNTENFLRNPLLQEKAFIALCKINKWILSRDIKRYNGKYINGIKVTESGILAAAHLAGAGSVKKFLRNGGKHDFKDAFGTTIQSYMKTFSGYNTSSIVANKKPVI